MARGTTWLSQFVQGQSSVQAAQEQMLVLLENETLLRTIGGIRIYPVRATYAPPFIIQFQGFIGAGFAFVPGTGSTIPPNGSNGSSEEWLYWNVAQFEHHIDGQGDGVNPPSFSTWTTSLRDQLAQIDSDANRRVPDGQFGDLWLSWEYLGTEGYGFTYDAWVRALVMLAPTSPAALTNEERKALTRS